MSTAPPTTTTPANSSSDHVCNWSADFDVEPLTCREAVMLWAMLIVAFVCTIVWLGISFGIMAVKMGLV